MASRTVTFKFGIDQKTKQKKKLKKETLALKVLLKNKTDIENNYF